MDKGAVACQAVSDQYSVSMTGSGPPETILNPEPEDSERALQEALSQSPDKQREAVAAVIARWPSHLEAWARLGDLGRDPVESYAAYRVGYHRGLDRLRQSGWKGSGFVRWSNPSNQGFLRALEGLARIAGVIGEQEECERCNVFLRQLDPDWSSRGPV